VFAILAVIFVVIFNIAGYTNLGGSPWMFRAIAANPPLVTLILINAGQAVVAIFLASEFMKQDSKNDSAEVIYARPMTNGDYIIGKTIGIIGVFLILNVFLLMVTGSFNLINPEVLFDWKAYLLYPVLVSIPTLVYILGLSFLFMVLFKNQAVTFIVLLGYIALTIFYLNQQYYHLFDYIAFFVPLVKSNISGLSDWNNILIHRGIYFFIGLGLVFFTGFKMNRLPQSRMSSIMFLCVSVLFLTIGGGLVKKYVDHVQYRGELQYEMMDLNDKYYSHDPFSISEYDIDFTHHGSAFSAIVEMEIRCDNNDVTDTLVFHLNPGLLVNEFEFEDQKLDFIQEQHLLIVPLPKPIIGEARNITKISYSGSIIEEAAYLDLDQEEYSNSNSLEMFRYHLRYAFLQDNYVLLTKESNWYPLSGVSYTRNQKQVFPHTFAKYSLTVNSDSKYTVVSQGEKELLSEGVVRFTNNDPLPQISLTIGDYSHNSIVVDSLEYNLYTHQKHDYYNLYFDSIQDTLHGVIKDLRTDFENKLDLEYPYKRFNLVEVPVNFYSHTHLNTIANDYIQPEIVLYNERGALMQNTDFRRNKKRIEDELKWDNEILTEEEIQVRLLKRLVENDFTGPDEGWWWHERNRYSIFPLYYTLAYHVNSEEFPLLNAAFESYIKERISDPTRKERNSWQGMSDEERVNIRLQEQSFVEFLNDSSNSDLHSVAVKMKGQFLFHYLKNKSGRKDVEEVLNHLFKRWRYEEIPFEYLNKIFTDSLDVDLTSLLDDWYNSAKIPGYIISDVQTYKFIDKDATKYQLGFKITNPEEVPGAVTAYFNLGQNKEWGDSYDDERQIYLPAQSTMEVWVNFFEEPMQMYVNTVLSKNIPLVMKVDFSDFPNRKKVKPRDEIVEVEFVDVSHDKFTTIVDNEDDGFEVTEVDNKGYLRQYFDFSKKKKDPYARKTEWDPPTAWTATTHDEFYGKYVRSAHYIRRGAGDKSATWNAKLPSKGYYGIYYYVYKPEEWSSRRRNADNAYMVDVYHEDGIESVRVSVKDAEQGWYYLGSFYIDDPENAKVSLTNNNGNSMVFADAVKWIKQ
jgi:ABC-type transport system involved in multi-copper enzyme maturation permease subunit